LRQKLNEALPGEVEILGKGLMMGLKLKFDSKTLRSDLLYNEKIFTGSSADAHIMRILPPLSIIENHIDFFVSKLSETYNKVSVEPSKI
jgi:acetylornithine aminotransferase